ncbi:hypothetical protein DPMN_020293 [Dreissena polymorpha]|uniref:Uncharacterized protein n=1 Tax=Dreissena polymorpha TaxID=45954 RepID=A0A9D4NIK5_DREPO|nr:hypothetical protein DPMN_100824 [Dreissena polymorpha]KAH3896120.1 hypothetical protein DPMN_020293 [Dreissena polymorpha]
MTPKLPCVSFCDENTSSDDQDSCGAQVGESLPVVVRIALTLFPRYILISSVVTADFGVKVIH